MQQPVHLNGDRLSALRTDEPRLLRRLHDQRGCEAVGDQFDECSYVPRECSLTPNVRSLLGQPLLKGRLPLGGAFLRLGDLRRGHQLSQCVAVLCILFLSVTCGS